MKIQRFFQSLTRQLHHWRRWYKALRYKRQLLGAIKGESGNNQCRRHKRHVFSYVVIYILKKISANSEHQKREIALGSMAKSVKQQVCIDRSRLSWIHEQRFAVVLAIAIVSLTGVMGHKLYNQPQLKVGTRAPETIKAPLTASIENKKETEAQRKAVSKSSLTVDDRCRSH
jgi:cyclic-di-AMP phosphodiesterase PgpH